MSVILFSTLKQPSNNKRITKKVFGIFLLLTIEKKKQQKNNILWWQSEFCQRPIAGYGMRMKKRQ